MRVRNMNNSTNNNNNNNNTKQTQQQQSQDDSSQQQQSTINSIDNNKNFLSPYNSNNFMAPPIGGVVRCTTCLGNTIQGRVMAYDQQTKMLVLRTYVHSKNGHNDISIVNVFWCKSLEVIEEPSEPPETLAQLNLQKLERRTKINIEKKIKEINSLGNDVSTLAQHLYFTILKTISEVDWKGKNIVVMDSVVIEPPYEAANCVNKKSDSRALEHVKKIVNKFHEDYKLHQQQLQHQLEDEEEEDEEDSTSSTPSSPLVTTTNENNNKKQLTSNSKSSSSSPPPPPSSSQQQTE